MASLPNSKTVTYEEWLRMPEVEDGVEEVVDGEILSPANTRREMERKLADYAAIGVPEVWVISPEARTVEVLHLEDNRLRSTQIAAQGTLTLRHFPGVQIDIATIWPD